MPIVTTVVVAPCACSALTIAWYGTPVLATTAIRLPCNAFGDSPAV